MTRIAVEPFRNKTSEAFLDAVVTNAVVRRFQGGGMVKVVATDQAEAVLAGEISAYQSTPVSYDGQDNISEYRVRMTITARLEDKETGRFLWQGTLARSEEFATSADLVLQEDREREVAGLLADDLADDLHERLTDNF